MCSAWMRILAGAWIARSWCGVNRRPHGRSKIAAAWGYLTVCPWAVVRMCGARLATSAGWLVVRGMLTGPAGVSWGMVYWCAMLCVCMRERAVGAQMWEEVSE